MHTQALPPPRVVCAAAALLSIVHLGLPLAWNSTTSTTCLDVPVAVWPYYAASVACVLTILELCPLFFSHRTLNCNNGPGIGRPLQSAVCELDARLAHPSAPPASRCVCGGSFAVHRASWFAFGLEQHLLDHLLGHARGRVAALRGTCGVCADDFGCLLYTSPSPRDATLSRMPSSA